MSFQCSCCRPQDTAEVQVPRSDNVAEANEALEPNRIARVSHEASRAKTASLPPSIKSARLHPDKESLREELEIASNQIEKGSSSASPPAENGHPNKSARDNAAEATNPYRPVRSPKQIWIDAYTQIKMTDKDLMDEYEKLLSSDKLQDVVLKEKEGDLQINIRMDCQNNKFANMDGDKQIEEMEKLTRLGLQKMKRHQENKVMIGMTALVDLVTTSQEIISDALAACPAASFAWAGVSVFILPAATNGINEARAKHEGLEWIIKRIPWYSRVHELVLRDSWEKPTGHQGYDELCIGLEEEICSLYCDLIEYLVKSVFTMFVGLGRKILDVIGDMLKIEDWGKKLQDIQVKEQQLQRRIDISLVAGIQTSLKQLVEQSNKLLDLVDQIVKTMRKILVEHEEKTEMEAQQRESEQLFLLREIEYEKTFKAVRSREGHTGDWLLAHEQYINWTKSSTGLLIVEANPGRGKSVLAKAVVNTMLEDTTKTICYFFFSSATERANQNRSITALRSILYQLFISRRDILRLLAIQIDELKHGFADNIDDLWTAFHLALGKCEPGDLVCVFDAIDECIEAEMGDFLPKLISSFEKHEKSKFRLFITTRNISSITNKFKRIPKECIFDLEQDSIRLESLRGDIHKVIDRRLEVLAVDQQSLLPQIRAELAQHLKRDDNSRTYLWVKIILDYLENVREPDAPGRWLEFLKKASKDAKVDDIYAKFLETVASTNLKTVQMIFQLVVIAFAPLDARTTNIAVHLELLVNSTTEDSTKKIPDSEYFRGWIIRNCGFFLELRDQMYLSFIHQTAEEYLLNSGNKLGLNSCDRRSCHKQVAKYCIGYLSSPYLPDKSLNFHQVQDLESESWQGNLDEYPFFEYSARFWSHHVQNASYQREKNVFGDTELVSEILKDFTEDDGQTLANRLNQLSTALEKKYQTVPRSNILTVAVGVQELAVSVTSPTHTMFTSWLKTLERLLRRQYLETGSAEALDRAIHIAGTQDSAIWSIRLSELLTMEYEHTGSIENVNRAIKCIQKALAMHPSPLDKDRATWLGRLGSLLSIRFDLSGLTNDLEAAIQSTEEAISHSTAPDSIDNATRSGNLGILLSRRFEVTGAVQDLDKAIHLTMEAISHSSAADSIVNATQSGNLGILLSRRFEVTGAVRDLNEAIELISKALELLPSDHASRLLLLSRIASQLGKRFEATGETEDLNRAIELAEEAITLTPQDNPTLASQLENDSVFRAHRFEVTRDIDDLIRAIDLARQAVYFTPTEHPQRAGRLANLATRLGSRYQRTEDMEDLNQAIRYATSAVDTTQVAHAGLATRLELLASQLSERFRRTGMKEDIDQATACAQHALDSTPGYHIDRAKRLEVLGNCLGLRFSKTVASSTSRPELGFVGLFSQKEWIGKLHQAPSEVLEHSQDEDLQQCISCFMEAYECQDVSSIRRIHSAWSAASLLSLLSDWGKANGLFSAALELLWEKYPPLPLYKVHVNDFSQFTGLASMAAAAALNANQNAGFALRLLELGRGIIVRELLSSEFEIDKHAGQRSVEPAAEDNRWPTEHQEFLPPPTREDFMEAADPDPIIVLNASPYRFDAIIIEKDKIEALELPQEPLQMPIARSSHAKPDLGLLWDLIAEPCLTYLGIQGQVDDSLLPHVWWIPIGPLSTLPIHAAGHHFPGSTATVLDRAMSSYGVSITSLIYARRNATPGAQPFEPGKTVLVIADHVPGLHRLPGAVAEGKAVERLLSGSMSTKLMSDPTKVDVLDSLSLCQIFHFAGWVIPDRIDPWKTGMCLKDWKEEPLTVADLCSMKLRGSSPFLSYISACDSASSNIDNLADEPLNLAIACQIAGFRHIIGTMGLVNDDDCVQFATSFYQTLLEEGMTYRSVYQALHQAAKRLRYRTAAKRVRHETGGVGLGSSKVHRGVRPLYEETFHHGWIPFVHFGVLGERLLDLR